jgi:hypothetical protein
VADQAAGRSKKGSARPPEGRRRAARRRPQDQGLGASRHRSGQGPSCPPCAFSRLPRLRSLNRLLYFVRFWSALGHPI